MRSKTFVHTYVFSFVFTARKKMIKNIGMLLVLLGSD